MNEEGLTVGGQYYWTSRLAPKNYARVLSYATGYLGWAGAVVVSGSVAVGLAQAIVGMIILANPDVLASDICANSDYIATVDDFCGLPNHQLYRFLA